MSDQKPAGRRQFILMLVIAVFSLGGSYGLFYLQTSPTEGSPGDGASSSWLSSTKLTQVWGTTNNGAFVDPPLTIAQLGWTDADGVSQTTQGQWWLWLVTDQCLDTCQNTLKNLRATHILLNKEAKRVRRAATLPDSFPTPVDQPDLVRIKTDTRADSEGIFIVDPNGNLVFFYAIDTDPKAVLKDLKRLLKVSQIG